MKKIIVLMVIILGIYSCRPEPEDLTIEYTINNISTHNVKFLVYHRQPNEVGTFVDTNIVFLFVRLKFHEFAK